MNNHGKEDHDPEQETQHTDLLNDKTLGERITRHLHTKAEHIQHTPAFRHRVMSKLPTRRTQNMRGYMVVAIALAASLLFALTTTLYFAQQSPTTTSRVSQIQYTIAQSLQVTSELAQGGQLLSIDPTEHHFVYQPANQQGVLYMADLSNPIQSNALAMRFARDMAWAPDGSALVATVLPQGEHTPLLALVPAGEYMYPLGPKAIAASWRPQDKEKITYTMVVDGHTELWQTTTKGTQSSKQAAMQKPFIVQQMSWSPDGKYLALVVSTEGPLSPAILKQPGRSIYIMDTQTQQLKEITSHSTFTIGTISWSPNGQALSYEQINTQHQTILHTVNVANPTQHFSITPKQGLAGWSWSPDSKALIYSDEGTFHTYVLQEQKEFSFPQTQGKLISPFWLKDGRIVCMHVVNGVGQLMILTQDKS